MCCKMADENFMGIVLATLLAVHVGMFRIVLIFLLKYFLQSSHAP